MTISDYTPLIEKIRSKIACWTSRFLSFAGRLQLIGSVIHSITNFWMAAFRLPSACIKEIDRLCSSFLWSGPTLSHNKAKVAWESVCKPKEEGGLGLRSLKEVNKVTCLKLIWRICSADSLWVHWIKEYLIRKGSFWSLREDTTLGSWMWRKNLKYRVLAETFIKVEVGNGRTTSFWFDNWTNLGRIFKLTGHRGIIDMGINIDATVEDVLREHRRRRQRTTLLNRIEDIIDEYRSRGQIYLEDQVLWRKADTYKAHFSSKETWFATRVSSPSRDWSQGIWFPYATPRYTFIAWLAIQDRLSTGDRMRRWNAGIDPVCGLCHGQMETRNHLFFQCSYVRTIWEGLTKKLLGLRFSCCWDEVLKLIVDTTLEEKVLFFVRYVFQMTIHSVWMERNGRRHGEPSNTSSQIIKVLDKNVWNRLSSIHMLGNRRFEDYMVTWFATR